MCGDVLMHTTAEPAEQRNTEFLLLVLLHSLGNTWRRAAVSLLKKRISAGLLNASVLDRSIKGHQVTLPAVHGMICTSSGQVDVTEPDNMCRVT
jgi:hypothetical protein